MLLHSNACSGAYFSTCAHSSCLKDRFSGPDSWIMCASWTADSRDVAMRMLEMEAAGGGASEEEEAKNWGKIEETYEERFGRTS